MAVYFKGISWNQNKVKYDFYMLIFCSVYLLLYYLITESFNPDYTFETLLIKSTASLAFCLLTFILAIGPLCRIKKQFLPLLYNRRHLGVTFFLVACTHAGFTIFQYNGFSEQSSLDNLFISIQEVLSLGSIPFELFGLLALLIFLMMALTSHDFWILFLGKTRWKNLHMFVYLAYYFIILHIVFGYVRNGGSTFDLILLSINFLFLSSIHLISSFINHIPTIKTIDKKKVFLGDLSQFENGKRLIYKHENTSIFIFKSDDVIYAVDNLCKHQGGPLSEGLLKDNCITCPWHGYQYQMMDGKAPFPYKEKINTYQVSIVKNKAWLILPSAKM